MKNNYEKEALLYINNNLDEKTIRYLENDDDFMKTAVKMSKSPELFEKCSDKLKNNADFIEDLVEVFKDNPKFLSEMVNTYIANNKDDQQSFRELNILLSDIYDETFADELEPFASDAYAFYMSTLDTIEHELNELDIDARLEAGEGFIFVDTSFHSSDIVKHYFAEKMIENIIEGKAIYSFEQLVHYSVSSLDYLHQIGERIFLMNLIGEYDVTLMDYVMHKQDLLDRYVDMMKEIEDNWEDYCKEVNTHNLDQTYSEMENYIQENGLSYGLVDLFDGIVNLSMNRGKICKYIDIDKNETIDFKKIDIPSFKFVKHMREFIDAVFEYDIPYDNYEANKHELDKNDNLIKVDFKMKRLKK